VAGKLFQRERRSPIKVDGEAQGEIAQPRAIDVSGLCKYIPARRQPSIGHHHSDTPRLTPAVNDAAVGEDGAVDRGVYVLQRQGRVDQYAARLIGVARDEKK